jgi:hypothetical protein
MRLIDQKLDDTARPVNDPTNGALPALPDGNPPLYAGVLHPIA